MKAQFPQLAKLVQLAEIAQLLNLTDYFKLQIKTLLLKLLHWYAVFLLLSSKIKLGGGLKNNTMHSYMSVRRSLKNDNR